MPLAKAPNSVLIDRFAGLAVSLVRIAVTLPWLMAAVLTRTWPSTAVAGRLVSYLAFFALAHGIDLIAHVPISLGGWGLRGRRNRRCSFQSCSALL